MTFKFSNLIFKIKIIIITLPLLFSLFFPLISCADEEATYLEPPVTILYDSVKEIPFLEKSSNMIYQLVNDYEFLFSPLSVAMTGGTICGYWCAVGGGLAGVLDEALIYFELANERYLTWGIFGAATGNILNPSSYVSKLGGFAVGILLPRNLLNYDPELIAPAILAISGNPRGSLCYVLDKFAIASNITDKHYLIIFDIGNRVTTKLLGSFNPLISNFVWILLGSIVANYENEIYITFVVPVTASMKAAENLYEVYGKFIPKEQLNQNIEKQAISLIGNQFMIQFLIQKLSIYVENVSLNFGQLNLPNNQEAWVGFRLELINVMIFIFPLFLGNAISNRIDSYFSKKLQYTLEDKIRSEFFSSEISSYLSNNPNTKVLIDNLKRDLYAITKSGSESVAGAVSASIEGTHGIGVILVFSPNILGYSFLYNYAKSVISNYLAAQEDFYKEKITALDSEIKTIMQHDAENIRTIVERDGLNATRLRLQQLYDTSREHENKQELWNALNKLWQEISVVLNTVANYYLIGNELNRGKLPFQDRAKALRAGQQIGSLLSWVGDNAQQIEAISQSLNRIMILEEKIHTRLMNLDQVNKKTTDGNQLIINNLELAVGNNVLVTIEDLKLDMNKVYVLDGSPGCGKSLLLSQIKGVKTNGVNVKGSIYYPLVNDKEPKIVMISQKNYFPINSSLQKIISWPDEVPIDLILNNKHKEEILSLLREIKLWEYEAANDQILELDNVKDWSNILSGGEQKKIMIISAILKKPDILILDESFAGLGVESTITAQQMLKKYLPPHTLIIVVDHESQINNYNQFYNKKLILANKSITIHDMQ